MEAVKCRRSLCGGRAFGLQIIRLYERLRDVDYDVHMARRPRARGRPQYERARGAQKGAHVGPGTQFCL